MRWHIDRRRAARLLGLLILLGAAGYFGGRHLWAAHHYRAARSALERRDLPRALAHLRQCLVVWRHRADVCLLAGRTARRAGAVDEAELLWQECARLGGPEEELRLERILLRAQRGDLPPDLEHFLWSEVEHHHPDGVLILEALAQGYLYSYRLPQALFCLDRWLLLQPNTVPALLWRGGVYEGMQRPEQAAADYRRAVEAAPDHDEARLRLATFLLYHGEAAEAVEHLERLYQRQPRDPKVLRALAHGRRLLGRHEGAEALLDALLQEQPGDALALLERARLALAQGQQDAAEAWLRRSEAADPFERETLYLLYQCLQRRGCKEEAERYRARLERIDQDLDRLGALNRQAAANPADPAPRYEAGVICLRNGQEQEASRWFAGALQVSPGHPPTHRALADYHARNGRAELAARHRRLADFGGDRFPPGRHEGDR